MKKIMVVVLSVFLAVSLMGNIILLMKLSVKTGNSESDSVYDSNNVPNELIGIWEAKAGRKVEIFEDGKVYWTYNASDAIYTGYIGKINGYSIVLSQSYEGSGQGNYQSMSEISEEELQNIYIIYDITMHGEEAFSAQNVDSREYAWSFIKSK
ncbi:MAG: hypothetical protein PHS82_02270 [Lachnospiraceae bacterium]|nr:hypothetical protein [Lachnospiraceae bacterium]